MYLDLLPFTHSVLNRCTSTDVLHRSANVHASINYYTVDLGVYDRQQRLVSLGFFVGHVAPDSSCGKCRVQTCLCASGTKIRDQHKIMLEVQRSSVGGSSANGWISLGIPCDCRSLGAGLIVMVHDATVKAFASHRLTRDSQCKSYYGQTGHSSSHGQRLRSRLLYSLSFPAFPLNSVLHSGRHPELFNRYEERFRPQRLLEAQHRFRHIMA